MITNRITDRKALLVAGFALGIAIVGMKAAAVGHAAEISALQTGPFNLGGGPQPQIALVSLANVGKVFSRSGPQPCEAAISFRSSTGGILSQETLAPATGDTATTSVSGSPFFGLFTSTRVRVDLVAGTFEWCLPMVTIGRLGNAGSSGETNVVISQTDFVPAT